MRGIFFPALGRETNNKVILQSQYLEEFFFEFRFSQQPERIRERYWYRLKAVNLSFQTVPVSLSNSFWLLRNLKFEKKDTASHQ